MVPAAENATHAVAVPPFPVFVVWPPTLIVTPLTPWPRLVAVKRKHVVFFAVAVAGLTASFSLDTNFAVTE